MKEVHLSPGEEHAFDELFRRHAPSVFLFALKHFQGNRADAEEIVQQVFLAVWQQYRRAFDGRSDRDALRLIMTIAGRRVIDAWRASRSAPQPDEEIDRLAHRLGHLQGPAVQVLDADTVKRFWGVLSGTLPPTQYRIAVLAWEMGLSDTDIGRTLGLTVATVYTHKSRARRTIEQIMNRDGLRILFQDEDPGPASGEGEPA